MKELFSQKHSSKSDVFFVIFRCHQFILNTAVSVNEKPIFTEKNNRTCWFHFNIKTQTMQEAATPLKES